MRTRARVSARIPETIPIDSRTGGYPRSLCSAIHYDRHVSLPQMSGASSTTQALDITVTGPPVTPQPSRSRSAPRSGVTPERVARAPRTAYELPQEFDIGRVNTVATTASMSAETGRDLPYGIIPNESTVKFKKAYDGGKPNLGYIAVLVVKDEDMALVSMSFKTVPWQIGKPVLEATNKFAVAKGLSGEFKQRYGGIDWIGIDKAALASHCAYLEKTGWFCTPDSCKGADQMVHVVKSLSADMLSANMPIGFVLAETIIPNKSLLQKYKVILGILQRRMAIGVSPEDDGASQATEAEGV